MRRQLPFLPLMSLLLVACGGTVKPAQEPKPLENHAATEPTQTKAKAAPVVIPEIAAAGEHCARAVETPKADACKDAPTILATLAEAGRKLARGDALAAADTLASVQGCGTLPPLAVATLRAELYPLECAETTLTSALDAQTQNATPAQIAGARSLLEASRLVRLRPKKGAFDILARAEADPEAAQVGTATLIAWKTALEKQESQALAQTKGAPAELSAIVRFEAANAWLAFAHALRENPLPDELKKLESKDPDLSTRYLAKLDEVTMPVVDRARQLAMNGLGIALRDGILVKSLPSFGPVLAEFRSRPGVEQRPTRELDLQMRSEGPDKIEDPATLVALTLPPWAAHTLLESTARGALAKVPVLDAFARNRGVPAALRTEIEKDKSLDDARRSVILLARTRMAVAYDARPDQEIVATSKAKTPVDQLRVAIAQAMLEPKQVKKIDRGPNIVPMPALTYDLKPLDALASKGGPVATAAAYDAALLSLEAAQVFTTPVEAADPMAPPTPVDPEKAYTDAVKRLTAVLARKDLPADRREHATKLLESAKSSLELLGKPVKPTTSPAPKPPAPKTSPGI